MGLAVPLLAIIDIIVVPVPAGSNKRVRYDCFKLQGHCKDCKCMREPSVDNLHAGQRSSVHD